MKLVISNIFVLVAIFSSTSSIIVESSELIGFLTLSRHGQRTPIVSLPNQDKEIEWSAEPGQLLNSGKVLHYKLGQWFRKRYRKFLPDQYSPKDIRIQSTDVDRVLMSAYCNLAGLYPPKGKHVWNRKIHWQPIPVHVMPDYYLYSEIVFCKNYFSLFSKYIEKSPEIFSEENEKLFQNINDKLNVNITSNFELLSFYFDSLYTQKFNGYDLPEWAKPIYEDWKHVEELIFQSMSNTTELAQMSLGGFAAHIINHFDSVINGTNNYTYSMNFGHDINVAGLLNILTESEPILPFYGSTILLELYKNEKKHTVKAFFKNEDNPVPIDIKDCGTNCDYKSFRKLLRKYAISEDYWEKICTK